MKERIKRTLSLLAIPVVLLMLTGVALAGTVHNVGKGTLYPNIQGAINDADPGNQINIDSGTYYENINVDKENLILNGVDTGTGKPVIDGGGNGNTINLSAKGITLAGFSVINAGSGWPGAGINVISNNNNIENNDA